MKKKLIKSCIIFSLCLTRLAFAQEIDTLFTTPEERAYLDFLRAEFLLNNQANDFNIDEVVPAVPVIEEAIEAPTVSFYSLGGIFTRQDGSRTVWLNEQNFDENNLPGNMMLIASNSTTLLRIQTDAGVYDLRAGQTLDVVNNRILESWQLPATQNTTETVDQNNTEAAAEELTASQPLAMNNQDEIRIEEDETSASSETINTFLETEEVATTPELIQQFRNSEGAQTDGNAP